MIRRTRELAMVRWVFVVALCLLLPDAVSAGVSASGWQLDYPTPLMRAAQDGNAVKVRDFLDKGHDVNEQIKKGKATPLIFAASAGKTEVVQLLLKRGANPNLCSSADVCPIWWATYSGSYETVKVLIEAGADINRNPGVDSLEYPALQTAVSAGRRDIVKLLLDRGIDIEYTNFFSENTALAVAVRVGRAEIAQMLIERGADLGAVTETPYSEWKSYGGLTAFELAKKEHHKAAVEVVERTLTSGNYKRPKYSVDSIINKLYHDAAFDLTSQGSDQVRFLRLQTPETLRRVRNTIFARKNYQFDDPQLVEYFQKRFQSYKPSIRVYEMQDVDKRNVQYMKEIEEYRAARDSAG